MGKWRPHIYRGAASKAEVDPSIVDAAIKAGKIVIAKNPDVPPIFSLGHLAHLSGAPYRYLREIVERQYDPYSIFTIRKRNVKSGFRTICVPPPPLMQLQRWLVEKVLNQGSPHTASTAFAPESSVLDAAKPHVGCRWLIKVDIRNFFESISEIAAYRVFHEQFASKNLSVSNWPVFAHEMGRRVRFDRVRAGGLTQVAIRKSFPIEHRRWATFRKGHLQVRCSQI